MLRRLACYHGARRNVTPEAFLVHNQKYSYTTAASNYQQKITPEVCNRLACDGYAVVDGLFSSDLALALREEVLMLYKAQAMHQNCTHLVKGNATTLLQKEHIHEAELTLDQSIQAKAPLCAQLNEERALAVMLSLFLPQLTLDSQAIKLQVNSGQGGCFPCHFDSDEMLDGRKVTCIFYLNPGWQPGSGGELRLYPFPRGPPVDIAPLQNRLVLFASTRMLHRVLPSKLQERVCFTIWLSQTRRRARSQQLPSLSALAAAANPGDYAHAAESFLMQPHVRKHVMKLVYAEEWARSIEESHPAGEGREQAVQQHLREVEIIKRALVDYLPAIDAMEQSMRSKLQIQGGIPAAVLQNVKWF